MIQPGELCARATDSDENAPGLRPEPAGATERRRVTLGSYPPPTLLPEVSPGNRELRAWRSRIRQSGLGMAGIERVSYRSAS